MDELARLARYPFLPQAGAYIEQNGPGLEELLADRVYAPARARGRGRILAALEDASVPTRALASARDALEELLSYVYARILVSAVADPFLVRRHALAEAVRAKSLLEADDAATISECARALALGFEKDGEAVRAHFTEYLKYAVHLKDLEWKLVRQPLARGSIAMEPRVAARLVQEALRRRIESELPKPLDPAVVKALADELAPVRELLAQKKEKYSVEGSFGKVDLSLMPPCMQHILGQLQRGENVSHNGRFAIVTFLHKIGMTSEDIMRLFAQAPDFREDLTRYQVEHITGVTSGTTYSVPGCDNLQTFNLCAADDLCRTRTKAGQARVRYPGDYYRYMIEAKPIVEAISGKIAIEGAPLLAKAIAMSYGRFKEMERLVASPYFAAMTREDILTAAARSASLKVAVDGDERRIVIEPEHADALLRLLESDALGEIVDARVKSAPVSSA